MDDLRSLYARIFWQFMLHFDSAKKLPSTFLYITIFMIQIFPHSLKITILKYNTVSYSLTEKNLSAAVKNNFKNKNNCMYTKTASNKSKLFTETTWVVKLLRNWPTCKCNEIQLLQVWFSTLSRREPPHLYYTARVIIFW